MAGGGQPRFRTTRWSLIAAASAGAPSPEAQEALAELCRAYWYPLYAFGRRRGYPPEDAEDLTQGFFSQLLERNALRRADPARGRFRTFLLTAFDHYVINEHDKASARKRGGGLRIEPLTGEDPERRYANEPRVEETPEHAFDRRWALALLTRVMARCAQLYERRRQRDRFIRLAPLLTGDSGDASYRELAADLGMTENAVKVAVHRLRKTYRRLLHDEVLQTVADADDVEDELRQLVDVLRRRPA
jgi:RNA polymerase sigma factor (sigma-70 family)